MVSDWRWWWLAMDVEGLGGKEIRDGRPLENGDAHSSHTKGWGDLQKLCGAVSFSRALGQGGDCRIYGDQVTRATSRDHQTVSLAWRALIPRKSAGS
jgi:hypothetical protein